MNDFINLFNFLTNLKLKNMDEIVRKYNKENCDYVGSTLNIYLTINGFRKTCLEPLSLFEKISKSMIDIDQFEKQYHIRVYKIENKNTNIHLITTLKTNDMKKLAKNYEKYTYGSSMTSKKSKLYQIKMGDALEYIHTKYPFKQIQESLTFDIVYNKTNIHHDIYTQSIKYDKLSQKDLKTIYKKTAMMHRLLKNISNKFEVIMKINLT